MLRHLLEPPTLQHILERSCHGLYVPTIPIPFPQVHSRCKIWSFFVVFSNYSSTHHEVLFWMMCNHLSRNSYDWKNETGAILHRGTMAISKYSQPWRQCVLHLYSRQNFHQIMKLKCRLLYKIDEIAVLSLIYSYL